MWTTAERLAARFDPRNIRERNAAYLERLTPAQRDFVQEDDRRTPARPGEVRYSIDGSRNPELFMPSELMRFLITGGFSEDPPSRELARTTFRNGIERLGVSEGEFWAIVSEAESQVPASDDSTRACRVRHAVLNAMRARFGLRFDEFLYTAVAPTAFMGTGVSDQESHRIGLMQEEAGCPD